MPAENDEYIVPVDESAIKKRPFLYIGKRGVVGLFVRLLEETIELCRTDQVVFEITIISDNKYSLIISSIHDLSFVLDQLNYEELRSSGFLFKVLKIISKSFAVLVNDHNKIEIRFSLDKTVVHDADVEYLKLLNETLYVAVLNRRTEIIMADKRQKYLNGNYHHFPQGVLYLYEIAKKEAWGKPEFDIVFDGSEKLNYYQIGLTFRTDWYPTPNIISFANNVHTIYGGSLVEGVFDGLIDACKIYVKENGLTTYKVVRKKNLNGLILVCSVRGGDFTYGGSFKEILEDDLVRKQVRTITKKLILSFLNEDKEKAIKFLTRFDTESMINRLLKCAGE